MSPRSRASSPIDCANIDLSVCLSHGDNECFGKKGEKKNEKKSEAFARLSFDINKAGFSFCESETRIFAFRSSQMRFDKAR